ncbi:tail fiber domain-containing protein [Enterobacter bugandensis]|uniref:tail fiber domain-containing protein n=1 Tax=Enterobacter bugandensis TaxID=881260 RepID=UPI0031D4F603
MSAGTITITNGSAIVGGVDTTFSTELAPGDFIVTTVGGVPYTLPIMTVDSDTQLTLVSNFTGPTQAGAAWSAVPRVALNMVTAALVAQSAEALRGLNYDKQNWQQVFSAAGNITVKLPDGTTFTGPSWSSVVSQTSTLDGKAGGLVQGSLLVTPGDSIGVKSGTGGDKTIVLVNSPSDGPTGTYVNSIAGNYYAGNWRMGAVRGDGVDVSRVQLNIYDGVSSSASFMFYPNELFKASSCGASGDYRGDAWGALNGWAKNISFYRENVSSPNDGGFVPFGRWGSYCSGGYYSTAGIGSLANGPADWADIVLTTLGDSGNSGQRIFQFTTLSGDIYSAGSGNMDGNYIFSKQPNCDITLKHDVKYDDGYKSYENIKQIKPATYIYNGDTRERVRRGVIAQDVMKIDSEYVKLVPAAPQFDGEGNRIDGDDTLALDNNVLLLDTAIGLHYLIKQVESLQEEVSSLKKTVAAMDKS